MSPWTSPTTIIAWSPWPPPSPSSWSNWQPTNGPHALLWPEQSVLPHGVHPQDASPFSDLWGGSDSSLAGGDREWGMTAIIARCPRHHCASFDGTQAFGTVVPGVVCTSPMRPLGGAPTAPNTGGGEQHNGHCHGRDAPLHLPTAPSGAILVLHASMEGIIQMWPYDWSGRPSSDDATCAFTTMPHYNDTYSGVSPTALLDRTHTTGELPSATSATSTTHYCLHLPSRHPRRCPIPPHRCPGTRFMVAPRIRIR